MDFQSAEAKGSSSGCSCGRFGAYYDYVFVVLFFLVSCGVELFTNGRDVVRGEGANNAIVDVQDLVKRIDFTSAEYETTLSWVWFMGDVIC